MLRLEMAEGSDGPGELADAHLLGCIIKAADVALHLGVPVDELEAKGRGLRVDSVRSSNGGRVLEFEGPLFEGPGKRSEVFAEDLGRGLDLQALRGVHYVSRGQAVVQP